ncbi:MAG: hypothetical protein ACRYG2_33445 [Janthinobacterium lividum]
MRSEDVRTLQLGPLWVLSALVGTHTHFDEADLAAFWDAVVSEGLRAPSATRGLLGSLTVDRSGLLLDLELDHRSVVSGLRDVVTVLGADERVEGYRRALVRIGGAVARARGPYGRQISTEDLNRLLLVAQLLDYSPSRADAA